MSLHLREDLEYHDDPTEGNPTGTHFVVITLVALLALVVSYLVVVYGGELLKTPLDTSTRFVTMGNP